MYASTNAFRRAGFYIPLVGAIALSIASSASAGVITGATMFGPNAGVGPGLGSVTVPAIVTVLPNNDNVPAPGVLDNNIFVPIKRFDFNGFIDIEFSVAPTSGITEYQVFESVDNNTGTDWNGYRMVLGHGVGPDFVKSALGDGLDFDAPTYDLPPVSSAMAFLGAPDEDTLLFGGGIHGSGAESYRFRVDVPDIATMPPLFSKFTIRQIPRPVPEPSTFMLLSLALAGMLAYRARG